MFDTLLADGIVSGASDKIAAFVVKCLAVAGGFLVGYFLGGVIAWALDRWVFAQKAPAPVKKAISWVAAVALALLVALIVFGDGGNGLFGRGGGTGDGKSTQTQDDGKGKAPEVPVEPKKDNQPPKKDDVKPPVTPMAGDIRVAILGGDEVKDGRFYQFDDDPMPKTFEEFKDVINARRKSAKGDLRILFRFKKEPLSDNHPAVRRVVDWVNQEKLTNRFE